MTIYNFNISICFHQWAWYIVQISGFMWQVAPDSKIQLVSCEMSPKDLLYISAKEWIRAVYVYIICYLIWSVLCFSVLSIFVDIYAPVLGFYVFQWDFLFKIPCCEIFLTKLSSYPHLKRAFGLLALRSIRLLLELRKLKDILFLPFSFLCWPKKNSVWCKPPQWLYLYWKKITISLFLTELSKSK